METNGHKKNCGFTDDLVAYLYDEMPASGRATFEKHLAACTGCTDAFAGISGARFEVFEWRREEFDALPTPEIVIPYPEKSVGLIDRLSTVLSWATVVPAMAAILVVLGVSYLLWTNAPSGEQKQLVAEAPKDVPAPVQTPAERSIVPTQVTPVPEVASKKSVTSGIRVIRARANKKVVLPRTQFAQRVSPKVNNNVAVNTVRAPRLGAYDEDKDDTSLRLSDLFDETIPPQE